MSVMKSGYVHGSVSAVSRDGRSRTLIAIILMLVTSILLGCSLVASQTMREASSMGFVKHVICSIGWHEPKDDDDASTDAANTFRPAMIYQLTETEDLQKTLFFKSALNAGADDVEHDWFNALSGKDYKSPTLDILNKQNATTKKYTPYDLYGFSGLKWSNYMGEWNWIKVYYCGADGHGGEDKDPVDQKINMYYEGRNRPLDQWADRFSSRDPRVKLTADRGRGNIGEALMGNLSNFLFSITKAVVAFNNMLFTKSMSNVVGDLGIDKLSEKIMTRLFNNLFMALLVMMVALLGASIMFSALIKKEFRKALTTVAKALAIIFMAFLMMANPKFFVNLPNYAGMLAQYLTMSVTQASFVDQKHSELCSVSTNDTVKDPNDNTPSVVKNGKINVDGITDWLDNLGDQVSRKTTCKYWEIFALTPWSLGQYGTTINNLWAKGKAPEAGWLGTNHELGYHPATKTTSEQSDYPGLAAVPLGNNQVMNNWGVYQISTQTNAHIPGEIADVKTGKIEEKPKAPYTDLGQLATRNRKIDGTNGDWWRIVDAVSGYDTKGRESGGSSSNSSSSSDNRVDKYLKWAAGIAANDAHGYSQDNRMGSPDYDCSSLVSFALKQAGFNVNVFSTYNEVQELEKAGFKKVEDADLATGKNLKPGDILWVNTSTRQHTEIYAGDGKTVGAHHDENGGIHGANPGDQTGDEISIIPYNTTEWLDGAAFRYEGGGTSAISTTSQYNSSNGNSIDVYSPKANTSTTEWWSTWIGTDAWNRVTIALISLVCCLALIGPLVLGVTILLASITSVVLMAFAPVVMILSLVPNIGNSLLSKWGRMLWGTVVKRGVLGIVYMLLIVITGNIMQNVVGIGNYMKSCLLLILVGLAFVKFKDNIIHLIMSKVDKGSETAVSSRMSRIGKSAVKITQAGALGAVKGVHDSTRGEIVRDAAGKKNGRTRKVYTKTIKHGKHKGEEKRIGRLGSIRRSITDNVKEAAGEQLKNEIQQTKIGRVLNQNVNLANDRKGRINDFDESLDDVNARSATESCTSPYHDASMKWPQDAVPRSHMHTIKNDGKEYAGERWCDACLEDAGWLGRIED